MENIGDSGQNVVPQQTVSLLTEVSVVTEQQSTAPAQETQQEIVVEHPVEASVASESVKSGEAQELVIPTEGELVQGEGKEEHQSAEQGEEAASAVTAEQQQQMAQVHSV